MSKCLAARILTAALAMTVCGAPCWGAAAWLAEDGGSTMGMAGAGRAALSLEAAALAANPAALGELPDNQRAAVLLIVLEGMSYNEAARIMGVPRDTVAQWRTRAMSRMFRSLIRRQDHYKEVG